MADGLFYVDSRLPHISADPAAVTLSTTDKAMIPLGNIPVLGSNYWTPGKAMRVTLFGRMTTGTTPGNGTVDIYWGSGADANGTIIGNSAAFALSASQTNLAWYLEFIVRCRAIGGSGIGSLLVTGQFDANNALVASTLQPVMVPASAPAAVNVDLTVANVISPQFKRSGSTVETLQVHDVLYEALN